MGADLSSIRYSSHQVIVQDWSFISVTGSDREAFFQGQITNDLSGLKTGEALPSARLSQTGRIQSYFFIAKLENELLILCPSELIEKIILDFNKFIIMDDVNLKRLDQQIYFHLNYFLDRRERTTYLFDFNFYGIRTSVAFESFGNAPVLNKSLKSWSELEEIRWLNGYPLWGRDIDDSMFINDSYLNEIAISYKKGCFLGQETAAKIENNRGAAYFPVLLLIEGDEAEVSLADFFIDGKKAGTINYQKNKILQADLFRDFRIEGKKLTIIVLEVDYKVTVTYLPFYKNQTRESVANELYHLGVDEFQASRNDSAMEYMKKAIDFDPTYSDAYESIGVILGRKEKYEEAITWMDRLLKIKSSSVMAHTNKSLFLMKLGKIEEAEVEKSLATVKTFASFGEEAKLKKLIEEEKQKKDADISRREKMFKQVLEIDADDVVALYGMADIAFYREKYKDAIANLEKVIHHNEKYSTAYLLLGKSLEATGNLEMAMQVYKKGIDVASRQGDMMPANEMQSRLNQLVMASRLA